MRPLVLPLLLFLLPCFAVACDRQEREPAAPPVAPDPEASSPDPVADPSVESRYRPLDRRENAETQFRYRHEDPETTLDLLRLQPGMTVADVGCGAGFFTLRLARRVGAEGRVFAVDIDADLLAALRKRLAEASDSQNREAQGRGKEDPGEQDLGRQDLGEVLVIHSEPEDPALPAPVDLLFLAHLDFYLFHPLTASERRFLANCLRHLRPEGRLAVVQWLGLETTRRGEDGQLLRPQAANLVRSFSDLGLRLEAFHRLPAPPEPTGGTPRFPSPHNPDRTNDSALWIFSRTGSESGSSTPDNTGARPSG